jgi:hypothetical protein
MARPSMRIISPHKRLGLFSLIREAIVDRWESILIPIDSLFSYTRYGGWEMEKE